MHHLSRSSAQQIVEEIGALVRQNINMMDETGHIIASTDPKRIGMFHQGAYQVISHRLPELYIRPEAETPTVRRGVNLPIEENGEIVGVIGITGGYDEVFAYGQIVKKMTEILIRERSEQDRRRLDGRVRSRFLEDWVLGSGLSNPQELSERGFALGVDIRAARRVLVVSARRLTELVGTSRGQQLLEEAEATVTGCLAGCGGALTLRNAGRQILLVPRRDSLDPEELAAQIVETVRRRHGVEMMAGVDGGADDLHLAYLQANRAWRIAHHRRNAVVSYCRLGAEMILDDVPARRKVEFLRRVFPDRPLARLGEEMDLLEAYFLTEGSLNAAAATLFIHKNTLQYRLRRLAEETGLDVRKPSDAPTLYLALLFYRDMENQAASL